MQTINYEVDQALDLIIRRLKRHKWSGDPVEAVGIMWGIKNNTKRSFLANTMGKYYNYIHNKVIGKRSRKSEL